MDEVAQRLLDDEHFTRDVAKAKEDIAGILSAFRRQVEAQADSYRQAGQLAQTAARPAGVLAKALVEEALRTAVPEGLKELADDMDTFADEIKKRVEASREKNLEEVEEEIKKGLKDMVGE